jgi:hypothetical protein
VAKSNDEEVRREVDRVLQELAFYAQEAQQRGLTFVSMSKEQLTDTIQQGGPVSFAWYGTNRPNTVRRGETMDHLMGLYNSGSVHLYPCYVSVFIGAGAAFMPDIEWAMLSGRDAQWPIRTNDQWLNLKAGSTVSVTVPYTIPANAPLGGPQFPTVVCWDHAHFSVGSVLARLTGPQFMVTS